ncbi:hypothetical protein NEUTE1DRAFT_140663 [Neurospora tetrasperma FGSC 2508]|uniref:Uncharacterized protein n=1 Tax=Neurospora tetrasperma (strain FGSC 2508 / ATCC MYA-4615 / P0657) TaxID=510951 RepID=F8MX78_NEUT8|nr:uncharacterized protein NEUTE1DRAFT_140663 [Neurospora tetrasperma FGSC 2508]EGO54349.1 hypothetical protein NEUTE1DRAFT_140663 [Neurospora tetrasperma FGSC 2508]
MSSTIPWARTGYNLGVILTPSVDREGNPWHWHGGTAAWRYWHGTLRQPPHSDV